MYSFFQSLMDFRANGHRTWLAEKTRESLIAATPARDNYAQTNQYKNSRHYQISGLLPQWRCKSLQLLLRRLQRPLRPPKPSRLYRINNDVLGAYSKEDFTEMIDMYAIQDTDAVKQNGFRRKGRRTA